MRYKNNYLCHAIRTITILGMVAVAFSSARADLTITMDYTTFNSSAPAALSSILINDSWGGGTSDATRLAAARAVMDQAKTNIESLFSGCTDVDITQTIAVDWGAKAGSVLATGGTSWDGSNNLTGGSLTWDNDGTSTFFTDLTPTAHTEYSASANDTRTKSLSGKSINVEDRWYANFLGTDAADNNDMLSVATHEIMHALGVLGAFPKYSALDVGSDGDLDLMADGMTYEATYSGGHTTETLAWDGPGGLATYYPNVIGPSIVTGTRGLLTDLDALLLANVHGWGDSNNFACVNQPHGTIFTIPEPTGTLVLMFGSMAFVLRRRK